MVGRIEKNLGLLIHNRWYEELAGNWFPSPAERTVVNYTGSIVHVVFRRVFGNLSLLDIL